MTDTQKTSSSRNNPIFIYIIISVIAFGVGYLFKSSLPSSFTVTLNDSALLNPAAFKCKTLASSYMYGNIHEPTLNAEINKQSKDTIAIEVLNDKELSFLTTTAVESGITQGNKFAIYENNSERIKALENYNNISFSVLNVNKQTGRGIWVKSSDGLGEAGYVAFLECK